MDIKDKIKYIRNLKSQIKEIDQGEEVLLQSGGKVKIYPIPALDTPDFFEILGMIVDALKNRGEKFNTQNFFQLALKYCFELVLVLLEIIVGDDIVKLSISDMIKIIDKILEQNWTDDLEKKLPGIKEKVMNKLLNIDLFTAGTTSKEKVKEKKI